MQDLSRLQGPAGGVTLFYAFNTVLTAPPAAGEIRFNSTDYSLVTTIWISDTDLNGSDMDPVLDAFGIGDILRIFDPADAAKFVFYRISSTADSGDYHTFGVEFIASNGTFSNGQDVDVGWGLAPSPLSSGAVCSGHIGDGAVVSGSIASGQIGRYHLGTDAGSDILSNASMPISGGSLVYICGDSYVSLAGCWDYDQAHAIGVALESVSSGQPLLVRPIGRAPVRVVGGLSLSPGDLLFVLSGGIATNVPPTPHSYHAEIGKVVDASTYDPMASESLVLAAVLAREVLDVYT